MFIALKRGVGAGVAGLMCLAATLSAGGGRAAEAAEAGWRVAYTSPGFPSDSLRDIAVTAPDSAWAVGSAPCCDEANQMLIWRWDGAQWQAVAPPTPPPGTRYPELVRVAASSDHDVWVFGLGVDTSRFAAHWDGTSWTTTDFGPNIDIFDALVPAPGDAWLVGSKWDPTTGDTRPIALRFAGQAWTSVPLPGFAERLSGGAPGDLWALGHETADYQRPIAMHWNGTGWQTTRLPRASREPGVFASATDIAALAPDDVWATESLGKGEGIWPGPVLLHWNGKRWRRVDAGSAQDSLYRLAPDGRGGLWIESAGILPHPDLLHYSGGQIVSRQPAPADPGATPSVDELALIPGTTSLWAVGSLVNDSGQAAATVFRYDS